VAFNELAPRRYGIAHVEYRYETFFFMYPCIHGSWGIVEQERFQPDGSIRPQMDSMPAPWNSQVELNYSYNFGIFSQHSGGPPMPGRLGFSSWGQDSLERHQRND
jgi:hypothetical protein